VGSKSNDESGLGCGCLIVIALIALLVTQCGGKDDESGTDSSSGPSATVSAESQSPKPVRKVPRKVTMSLAEIVKTPGTLARFKTFVAAHGTTQQKQAVKHLKTWRGYTRAVYPAIEVESDFPTVNYEADGAVDKMLALEEQSEHIAAAFAAWWRIDEPSVVQIFDRGGEYPAGTSCIRVDSFEVHGSCL